MKPGVYPGMTMAEYLAIPALSGGVVEKVVSECAFAAWFDSFLNPNRPRDDSAASDKGSVAHAILLEGSEACVRVIDPNDHPAEKTGNIPDGWTNKSIRAARDDARAAGLIPMLAGDMSEIRDMVGVARTFIDELRHFETEVWRTFQPGGGESETTMLWQDGETLCKIRPDLISTNRSIVINYKTTQGSVEPERWARGQMLDYYVSAAFYIRGIRKMFDVEPEHLFLVQQQQAPYLCSLIGMDPQYVDLGSRKVDAGMKTWEACVRVKAWPGYPVRAVYPTVPPWESTRWEEREAMQPLLGSQA